MLLCDILSELETVCTYDCKLNSNLWREYVVELNHMTVEVNVDDVVNEVFKNTIIEKVNICLEVAKELDDIEAVKYAIGLAQEALSQL